MKKKDEVKAVAPSAASASPSSTLKEVKKKSLKPSVPSGESSGKDKVSKKASSDTKKEKVKKKDKGELDKLFSGLSKKKKKKAAEKDSQPSEGVKGSSGGKKPKNIDEDLGLQTKERKYTEEGYPIYTEEELKIGQGGGTPDCPFDCWCCF
uniref:DUF1764 domain-containing protein n=1 Tax=Chromera velia CCMP2878 TaxID=1169474 RepID=A0A0G4HK08_9ALVE|mmetsp:Transcript_54855/g.107315  ORF Transcript_54855/g.107315 Transcript_54855/m.107315 type:complete len:151 (-) Transcript_54855:416-868(-)|eukprot:Cvel_7213.t1-p1 / transcript=Cvel_7213.t1 / gene=Cvel_7213 / organism=Chromera_velia_CCMP2878 / gene_product=hypothetical protein / transcript_product=hypothetical protein / location=Cvel_scaffold371:76162-77437(-) / protein_length=150 / sequence_SO=supercontig / SO=protein_coding / is_pseudo=false